MPECPICLANGLLDGDVLAREEVCYLVTTGDPVLQASIMVIAVGGQDVPHAHLHLIGRFADEPLAGQGIRHALKQESVQPEAIATGLNPPSPSNRLECA